MGEILARQSRIKRDLILGYYSLRKEEIISVTDFYDSENYRINSFVNAIHLVTCYQEPLGFLNLLYFEKPDNSKHLIKNERILDCFLNGKTDEKSNGISLFTTNCGIILIWGKLKDYSRRNFLYSTIDMENFNFHDELNPFLENNYIYRFLCSEGEDFVVVSDIENHFFNARKVFSQIKLQDKSSVSLSFSEYMFLN